MDKPTPVALWLRSLEGQAVMVVVLFGTLCAASLTLLGPRDLML